jgi:hypothetical protein
MRSPLAEIQRCIEAGIFHRATANAVVAMLRGWALTDDDLSYVVVALKEAVRIAYHTRHYHHPAIARARVTRLIHILRKLGYHRKRALA